MLRIQLTVPQALVSQAALGFESGCCFNIVGDSVRPSDFAQGAHGRSAVSARLRVNGTTIEVPRQLCAFGQAAASLEDGQEEQAGQWVALEPLAAQGDARARVIVQTRLHVICPTPGLTSRVDSDVVLAPFVAHGRHIHSVVVGAKASADAAAVRSEDRALKDRHFSPHDNPQTQHSIQYNLKHGIARPVRQLGMFATQPCVQHSHPFGRDQPNLTVPQCCLEEGGQFCKLWCSNSTCHTE